MEPRRTEPQSRGYVARMEPRATRAVVSHRRRAVRAAGAAIAVEEVKEGNRRGRGDSRSA